MTGDIVRASDLCEVCAKLDDHRGVMVISMHAGERIKTRDIPSTADACRRCGLRPRRVTP